MALGKNLQFLRKLYNKMTQEELAEKMGVSRQTVSKWELDAVYPEVDKLLELCKLFSVSLDSLLREDMTAYDESYSDMRIQKIDGFKYAMYTVISGDPETDAIERMRNTATAAGDKTPDIVGWDFPFVSQEQTNVYHMHGYTAAWIIKDGITPPKDCEVLTNPVCKYAAITIKNPMAAPFSIIPNAYKTLMAYMIANGCNPPDEKNLIDCFERSYYIDGVEYMDVFMAVK
ncbi:MAG: helix-turn-helix domain-containing protein [Clostridiales bacterium]|nr:helix-turn-helix domain-containing protein [Clostridiales bacterium]